MSKFRVVVKGDKGGADVEAERMRQLGFAVDGPSQADQATLNGLELGGHVDVLTDSDGEVYVVIGWKS